MSVRRRTVLYTAPVVRLDSGRGFQLQVWLLSWARVCQPVFLVSFRFRLRWWSSTKHCPFREFCSRNKGIILATMPLEVARSAGSCHSWPRNEFMFGE